MSHIPLGRIPRARNPDHETRKRQFAAICAIGRRRRLAQAGRVGVVVLVGIAAFAAMASLLAYGPSLPDWIKSAPQVTVVRGGMNFRNCAEARTAGAAPIYRGQPGYSWHLDADHDGIACEPYPRFWRW